MMTNELQQIEYRELYTELGALRQQVSHIEKNLNELRTEIAQNRKTKWLEIFAFTGVLMTAAGGLGGLLWSLSITPLKEGIAQMQTQEYRDISSIQEKLKEKADVYEVNRITSEIIQRLPKAK
jgi:hypothetical protein